MLVDKIKLTIKEFFDILSRERRRGEPPRLKKKMKKVFYILEAIILGVFFYLYPALAADPIIDKDASSSLIMQQTMLTGAPGDPAVTYATWNPDDKDAHVVLSDDHLTYNNDAFMWHGVRSTVCKSTGKWYWEQYMSGMAGLTHDGIGNTSASLTSYPGIDANAWNFRAADSSKCHEGITSWGSDAPAWEAGDVLGIAIDLDNNRIDIYVNNDQVMSESMFTNVTGNVCAFSGMTSNGATFMTANFGATNFVYNPPDGYNYGLFDEILMDTSTPQIGEITQTNSGADKIYDIPFLLLFIIFIIFWIILEILEMIKNKYGSTTDN